MTLLDSLRLEITQDQATGPVAAQVIRIENRSGWGPYNWRGEPSSVADFMGGGGLSWDTDRHPAPWDDPGLRGTFGPMRSWDVRPYIFGFSGRSQLTRWVWDYEWREILDSEGYVASHYNAAEAYLGTSQVMFVRASAQLSHRVRLTELTLCD